MNTTYGERPGMSEQRGEHTPGPWAAHCYDKYGSWKVIQQDNPSGHQIVDNVRGLRGECEANARLIAQAPALLAACEALVKAVDDLDAENGERNLFVSPGCVLCTDGVTPDQHNSGLCAYHSAVAAIAAARGAK